MPFNLTQSRTFDIWGWDSGSGAPIASTIQFRWNANIAKYEVVIPGYAGWNRLEARPPDFRLWHTPVYYDVFGGGGTKLLPSMFVWLPTQMGPTGAYVGDARILDDGAAGAWFKFGMRTEPGDVPVSGIRTCHFGEDEIGGGELTFDLAAGIVSGWVEPFWAPVRYQLVPARLAAGALTFAVGFGTDGVLEGQFYGPRAADVAVRSRGGGEGFAAVNGVMAGWCE